MTKGFSLIEMLVVLVLIGLSLGVVLSVGLTDKSDSQQQQLRFFGNELRINTASAVLDGNTLGLDFFVPTVAAKGVLAWRWLIMTEDGWSLLDAEASTESKAQNFVTARASIQLENKMFASEAETTNVSAEKMVYEPEVWLYPTREVTPFRLELEDSKGIKDWLETDLMGRVRVNEDAIAVP